MTDLTEMYRYLRVTFYSIFCVEDKEAEFQSNI